MNELVSNGFAIAIELLTVTSNNFTISIDASNTVLSNGFIINIET